MRERVNKLRRMQKLLEPFSGTEEDAQPSHIQENLVTRNGEIEKELERMRMLLARVGGRVTQIPARSRGTASSEDEMDFDTVEAKEQAKVKDLFTRM